MKKLISLVLAAMLLLGCCSALAEAPEGYPDIIPGLDFGGQDVYIYDWWSADTREEEPNEDTQLTYDYRDWLEATYNCKLHEVALSDWEGNPKALGEMVLAQDSSKLCILGVGGAFAGKCMFNGLYMPWTYNLEGDFYLKSVSDFMTVDGKVYGVSADDIDPRQMVFFNKNVLEDANIDWNELYDLQASNEWTWAKMEEYMDKVQRDLDGDGTLDVFALTGNGDDVTMALMVSNGADFYDFDADGKIVPSIETDAFLEALDRRIEWNKYMEPNQAWDDYKAFWAKGNVAFMIGQSYEGFNGNDVVNNIDEWGAVCIPVGPSGKTYTSAVENNVFGIPNVYDEETSLKLQQIYTLYRMPTPGVEQSEDSWMDRFMSLTCDDRAIEESYAMLREGEHATMMKYTILGDRNSVVTEITWHTGDGKTAAELVKEALPAFQGRCDVFNGDKTQEQVDAELAALAAAAAEEAAEEAPAE